LQDMMDRRLEQQDEAESIAELREKMMMQKHQ
jgi:hypothetical protein